MKQINCILLIDDDVDDNEYHETVITNAHVCNEIRIAENGIKGIEYLLNTAKPETQKTYPKPDIIFLDINMPRMNGFEFLDAYNNLDEEIKTAIVICMLTTSLNPDDQKKATDIYNVKDFYPKPLSIEILHGIIEKYF